MLRISSIEPVELGSLGRSNSVFLWLWSVTKPYTNYGVKAIADHPVAEILAQLRWDNTFGVGGGKVDAGETMIDALKREVAEELNYNLTSHDLASLRPLSTFAPCDNPNHHIHAFTIDDRERARRIMDFIVGNHQAAPHFRAESGGVVRLRLHLIGDQSRKDANAMRSLPWAGSGAQELELIFKDIERYVNEGGKA